MFFETVSFSLVSHVLSRPRVHGGAKRGVRVGAAHPELVHVGLGEEHRAAARERLVTVLSNAPGTSGATKSRSAFEPAVVGAPGTKKLSLTAIGTPSRRLGTCAHSVVAPNVSSRLVSFSTRGNDDDDDDAREADRARLLLRSSLASARSIARGNTPPMNALRCRVAPIRRVAAVRRSDALVAPDRSATAVSTRVDAVRGKRDISRARTQNESGAASAPAPGAASRASRSRRALRTTRRGRELCRRENSARRALRRQGTAVTRGGFVNWRKVQRTGDENTRSERCATHASTRRWQVCWIPPRVARGGPPPPRMASSRASPRASCWSAPRRSCWCVISVSLVVLHFPMDARCVQRRSRRSRRSSPLAARWHPERRAAESPRAPRRASRARESRGSDPPVPLFLSAQVRGGVPGRSASLRESSHDLYKSARCSATWFDHVQFTGGTSFQRSRTTSSRPTAWTRRCCTATTPGARRRRSLASPACWGTWRISPRT